MKNIIYIFIIIFILSCNKKAENNKIDISKKEQLESSKKAFPIGTSVNLDSLHKENSEKKVLVVSDSNAVTKLDVFQVNKLLNGVWYPINKGINGQPDYIFKDYIYIFNIEKSTIDVIDKEDYWENFSFRIINTDCDSNVNHPNTNYLKLSGDDEYCSKIIALKKTNNKTYLILNSQIANRAMTEFLKISEDPRNFPKGFKLDAYVK